MLRPDTSGTGLDGLEEPDSFPLRVATARFSLRVLVNVSSRFPTSVQVGLLSQLVIRVTVGNEGPIELLERHKRMDELVVGLEEASEPLFALDVVDLTFRSIL